jgi:hypothetical protein
MQNNGVTTMMVAVKENRLSIVERLLDMGAEVNAKAKVGNRPNSLYFFTTP